ncbi:MAG: hypothetical protein CSB24_01530 [Deltaproteobacteria bacterium]|nr:MAG: hypothetical protein CSB24_01530 [Deltaproteobacteria bacterium]
MNRDDIKGFFKKLSETLRFDKTPDTAKELENEIQELLEEGEEQGLISSLEEKMITSIFGFRDTKAAEVMTPAVEIVSVDVSTPLPELIQYVVDSGFTRIPVFRENHDRIVGIVHVKDLLKACLGGQNLPVEDYINPAYFVLENKPIVDILKEFQKRKFHLALVNDEFGAIRGLITLEDILEEIVGEIDDEFDTSEEQIKRIDDSTIIVQARTDVEVVEEQLGIEFGEGPYESLGGMIIHALGRLPKKDDTVEIGGWLFKVVEASERHIKSIEISRKNKDTVAR